MLDSFRPGRDGGSNASLDLALLLAPLHPGVCLRSYYRDPGLLERACGWLLATGGTRCGRESLATGQIIDYSGVQVSLLPVPGVRGPGLEWETLKSIRNDLRCANPPYLFTFDSDTGPLLAAQLLGIPGAHFFNSEENVGLIAGDLPILAGALASRQLYAVSRSIARSVRQRLGVAASIWQPPVEFSRYRTAPRHDPAALGFVARGLEQYKGDEVVCEMASLRPDWRFVVAGNRLHSSRDDVPGNIEQIGPVVDMRQFYGRVDLLLVPSLVREGLPRVILEAAVNGIPCVATRIGGIPEAVGDGGVLVGLGSAGPGGIADLASRFVDAVDGLRRHPERLAKLARAAEARALRHAHRQGAAARRWLRGFSRPGTGTSASSSPRPGCA